MNNKEEFEVSIANSIKIMVNEGVFFCNELVFKTCYTVLVKNIG